MNRLCKTCNHPRSDHIHGEGECRPGYYCGCEKFSFSGVPEVTVELSAMDVMELAFSVTRQSQIINPSSRVKEILAKFDVLPEPLSSPQADRVIDLKKLKRI